MSLLQMCQDAALLVGIAQPSAIISSTEETSQQLRALAQQEGDELSRAHDWRRLKVQATITGDGSTTLFDLPDDFDRQVPGDALWLDDSPQLPLIGPISDEEMLALQAATANPSRPVWRYFGDQFEIWPALSSTQTVTYEYRTSEWIVSFDGTATRSRWVADSDLAKVPERIMTLGLVWRWKRAKGLDYAEEFESYQMEKTKAMRADGGFRRITLATGFRDEPWTRKNDYRVV